MLLNKYEPDIICLQEARINTFENFLFLNRYQVFKVTINNGGFGLKIIVRYGTYLILKAIQKTSMYLS